MPRNSSDDFASIKNLIDFLSEKVDELMHAKKEITEILLLVTKFQAIIAEKDKQIECLEEKVEELEQYSRRENIIITGLKTRHRTYARASTQVISDAHNQNAPEEELQNLEHQVIGFLNNKLELSIKPADINACHTIKNKQREKPDNIIIRFISRKNKVEVLKQSRKLKGTNIYINEHLTPKNNEIAKKARLLRKQGKISRAWIRDCKVFIKTNGIPEVAKTVIIRKMSDFVVYERF